MVFSCLREAISPSFNSNAAAATADQFTDSSTTSIRSLIEAGTEMFIRGDTFTVLFCTYRGIDVPFFLYTSLVYSIHRQYADVKWVAGFFQEEPLVCQERTCWKFLA